MTKTELIDSISAGVGITKQQADLALDAIASIVHAELRAGTSIKIPGIGTLETREVGPREARNPRTGEAITVDASTRVAFRPSATLKRALNPS